MLSLGEPIFEHLTSTIYYCISVSGKTNTYPCIFMFTYASLYVSQWHQSNVFSCHDYQNMTNFQLINGHAIVISNGK